MKYDLGDLFQIFPDLPWNRTAMTAPSRALERVPMRERLQAAQLAIRTAQRRVQIAQRRKRR